MGSSSVAVQVIEPSTIRHGIGRGTSRGWGRERATPVRDGDLGANTLFRPSLVAMMIGTEHEMLTKFLKLMPPVFHGSEGEDGSSLSQIATRGFIRWTLCINTG
ncbi:hypothetical protein MTR67_048870 [Solanum verrucosum]|uniref:Uncharacterized protein n=1 Tax=Solanum verrucosum TaxID=315347 RepID=A0AAF0V0D0_SOLVR|nr:hypothetical protein MTR67_048870 [Solanum verrucosum]